MSSVGALRSKSPLGAPLWFKEFPSRGFLPLGLSGVPPLSIAARHGRALMGGGYPSPFSPSLAACVRRARPFWGGTLLRLPIFWVPLIAYALEGFVSPLLPLCVPASCGPMAVFGQSRPRTDWASHRRCRSRAGEVCWRVPHAAVSLLCLCLCLRILSPRCASSRRAVSAIRWALPGGLGGWWVFVPSHPPSSVLPLSGSVCCGGSQDFDFLGDPIPYGGRVIP